VKAPCPMGLVLSATFGLARQHALSKARRQCNLALDILHQMMYPYT